MVCPNLSFFRKGRKKGNNGSIALYKLTLHEHLYQTGCTTEVTINLERCMSIKEVRICAAT